ncbi:MAG: hypothetical protein BWK80_19135 [Desulfobacteraceae bacterium IS3]|nr:MAG: hypothetical protein BWK80_19135 [Desulfobacteraceae bacterium IS3]HAO19361.1 hypothetical protein [Desulfobacteraceae bacterium]
MMNSEKKPLIASGICQAHCPTRWCCSVQCFVPVPVYPEQIQTIEQFSGKKDFYEKTGSDYTLKTRENQYCIFFDDQKKECGIYPVRPFDCLIYPFDFYAKGNEGWWLVWDCPYSQYLSLDHIDQILTHFETRYAQEFFRIWDYANDSIDPDNPEGFRMLRKMNLTPHFR